MKKCYAGFLLLALGMLLLLVSCKIPTPSVPSTPPAGTSTERPVIEIPLTGPIAAARAEISGMAWYGDELILLPQYPGRFDDALFALSEEEIRTFLAGDSEGPLDPRPIPFNAEGVDTVSGFEGYESIAFSGDRVYLTIEARANDGMVGYLVSGTVYGTTTAGPGEIRIDVEDRTEILPQAPLANMTDETLVVLDGQLLTFYEANGTNVNPEPVGHLFSAETLAPLGTLPFPTVEYRITDATAPNAEGHFWALNVFWSGDAEKLQPGPDQLAAQYGEGTTHARSEGVERIVEYWYEENAILRPQEPPLWLELRDDGETRNWEGLVTLGDEGFLLVTDQHPETILGFVSRSPDGTP